MSFAAVPASMYDEDFARLSPDAQRLEFFIRSHPHRGSEGLSRLKFGAVEDAIGMNREETQVALKELIESKRPFMYDAGAGVILDQDALKTQPLGKKDFDPADWLGIDKAERRIKGAISKLRALPDTPLLKQLLILADLHSPQLGLALRDEFPDIEAPLEGLRRAFQAPYQGTSREESSSDEESGVERKDSYPLNGELVALHGGAR